MAGERYHILYHEVYGIRSSVLRLTNTYGPRMRIKDARQTFLGIWIRNLLEGKPIQVYGDGRQRRDYNYVDDVVDALLLSATRSEAEGRIHNLGAPDPMSLKNTAKLMCELSEGATFENIPFPKEREIIDVGDFVCAYEAFQSSFNWKPKVKFQQGMSKSIEYFRENLDYYI